jgi:hypothetical protein
VWGYREIDTLREIMSSLEFMVGSHQLWELLKVLSWEKKSYSSRRLTQRKTRTNTKVNKLLPSSRQDEFNSLKIGLCVNTQLIRTPEIKATYLQLLWIEGNLL